MQLHYLRLPKDISEDFVILMDSTVSTGAAALMAIRVLLVSLLIVLNPPVQQGEAPAPQGRNLTEGLVGSGNHQAGVKKKKSQAMLTNE